MVASSLEAAREFLDTLQPKKGKAYGRLARSLMHELHQEQAELRRSRRKYELPDIRTGDVVKVTYYESCAQIPAQANRPVAHRMASPAG